MGDGIGLFGLYSTGIKKIADCFRKIMIHEKLVLDLGNAALSDSGVNYLL